jgi:hypothetical protein
MAKSSEEGTTFHPASPRRRFAGGASKNQTPNLHDPFNTRARPDETAEGQWNDRLACKSEERASPRRPV